MKLIRSFIAAFAIMACLAIGIFAENSPTVNTAARAENQYSVVSMPAATVSTFAAAPARGSDLSAKQNIFSRISAKFAAENPFYKDNRPTSPEVFLSDRTAEPNDCAGLQINYRPRNYQRFNDSTAGCAEQFSPQKTNFDSKGFASRFNLYRQRNI